jgi:transaldolase
MKFFIDTANLNEIREAQSLGILDGVTTNPTLMAKEGVTGKKNIMSHYEQICKIVDGDVNAEVLALDFEGMIKEGEEYARIDDRIIVKVPMVKEGIKAIKYFADKGIKTNTTLVFSAGQALMAAKAGTSYVSPFIGRLDDIAYDGLELVSQIRLIFDNYAIDTEILAASVRHTMHLIKCAELGADIATCPLKVILGLLNHPLTDKGMEMFIADGKKLGL